MNNTKLKKGLTYISERTDQMRYSDKNNVEQWLHPISVYYPLEAIKRGQPVSAATYEDVKEVFAKQGIEESQVKLNPDITYAVLTNPSKHSSCIGLAMEHCEDPFKDHNYEEQTGFKTLNEIHILGCGKFKEDPIYYKKSHQQDLIGGIGGSKLNDYEYIPEFLADLKNIGKKIFVRGVDNVQTKAGLLTVVPEEAYLANNNIIQVGFMADGFQGDIEDGAAAIEMQIEGDDRGPLDHTQFELPIGESELVIKEDDPIRVFALGEEDNSKFAFHFGIRKVQNFDTENNNGYIGIRRFDGKTALISFANLQTSTPEFSSIYTHPEDRAFIEVSKHYNPEIKVFQLEGVPGTDDVATTWNNLTKLLNQAIAEVAKGIKNPNPAQSQEEITGFTIANVNSTADTCYGEFTANAFGGDYEIYVSTELAEVYELVSLVCHGSYNNKGMAILADIRNTKRQNIIGVYDSGNYGKTLKYGERAIFTHLGVFQLPKSAPESILTKGAQYYLGSCGTLTTIPQSYYNTVVKIGSAENTHRFLVMCDDAREFWDGELPIGFMKPTVHGFAEYGYLVMDGKSDVPIEGHEQLLKHIQNCMPGKVVINEEKGTFILPKVVYGITYEVDPETHVKENELAQVKAIAHGIYQKDVPHPFVRQEWKEKDPNIEVDNSIPGHPIVSLPNIDVTSLVVSYGIIGDNTSFFNSGDVEVKVFVDCRKDTSMSRRWTEVHPGFKNFNNLEFYGYEWHVEKTKDNSEDEPFGRWEIKFTNNLVNTENQLKGYGPCIEVNPFEPATSIAGMPLQIVVYRHDMWERQFDLQGVFNNMVSQEVISVVGGDGTHQPVSGNAVKKYINSKVETKELEVNGKISLGIKDSTINIESVNNIPQLKITGTATLDSTSANPDLGKIVIANKDKHLGFYFLNNNNQLEELDKETIKDLKLDEFKNTDFIIKEFLENHKNEKIVDSQGNPVDYGPHGIINNGLTGNLHAVTLAGFKVGTAATIIDKDTAKKVYNGRIPYIHTNTDLSSASINDYEIELPVNIAFSATTGEKTPTLKVNPDGRDITTTVNLNQFTKITKSISHPDNYIKEIFDFLPSGGGVAWNVTDKEGHPLKHDANSTIKVKSLNSEFIETHTNLNLIDTEAFITEVGEEHRDTAEKLPLKQNALQALSLMPTAAFHYLSENDNVKRWFGIITERIAEAKQKVSSTTGGQIGSFSKDGTFDVKNFNADLKYTFTEEEANSVKEYLNFITNENDNAQNILSTVGVLLEAAKETQMRLLPNEASIYGADASTIPGDRSEVATTLVAPDYATNTPTHLGLNRLVKALCAEVFLDADPKNIGEGSGADPEKYSRLDKVCKAIYGKNSNPNPGEGQEDIPLEASLGESMPSPKNLKKISRAEAYTIEKAPQSYEDAANAIQYNEDTWIASKENNAAKADDVALGVSADPYDGIHDAVNRIALKLNRLTEELHEIDNINAPLAAIDRIRDNIETLLLEVYDKEYSDDTKQPFKKAGLSRIDLIEKDLYSGIFELADEKNIGVANKETSNIEDTSVTGTGWNVSKRKFNEKPLLVYNTKTATGTGEANTLTQVSLKVPTSVEDLGQYANILDMIIDYIAGTTNDILKNNNKSNTNNVEKRKSENLTERIVALETSLDKVTKRITDTKELEDIENQKADYKKVKDIDSFIAFITGFLGIEVTEENGQLKWIVPSIQNVDRFDLLAGPEENRVKPADKSTAVNNLYGRIVDIVFEMQADDIYHTHLNALLGSTYKISTVSTETPKRNLTVEMDKLNRLFYGITATSSESGNEITTFEGHNKETDEKEHLGSESFTSSVIDTLYASLYTMPSRYKVGQGATESINPGYIDRDDTTKYLLSDKITKENKLYCAKDKSSNVQLNLKEALTSSERRTFLDGSFTESSRRWNRFEAIEDQLVALRNMTLGALGNNSDSKISYKDVNFVNRDNGIATKTSVISKDSVTLAKGIEDQYVGNNDTATEITQIGGNPISLIHSNNLSFDSSSAIGIAALAFNIAEHNHSAIAALNNLLFTRAKTGNEQEDAFYKQFCDLRKNYNASDEKLTKVDGRVEALETSKEDNSADIDNLRNKLGVKDSTKDKPGEWLKSDEPGYSNSLKGMHDSLKSHVGEWTPAKVKAAEASVCSRIEAIEEDIGTDSVEDTVKSRIAALESVDSKQEEANKEFKEVFGTDFYENEKVKSGQSVTDRLKTLDANWKKANIGAENDKNDKTLWGKANSTATSLATLTKNVEDAELGTKSLSYDSPEDIDTAWDKIKKIDLRSTENKTGITTLKTQTGLTHKDRTGIVVKNDNENKFIPNTIEVKDIKDNGDTPITPVANPTASIKEALATLQQQLTNLYKGVGKTEADMKGGIGVRPKTTASSSQPIPNDYNNLWDSIEKLYSTQTIHESRLLNVPEHYISLSSTLSDEAKYLDRIRRVLPLQKARWTHPDLNKFRLLPVKSSSSEGTPSNFTDLEKNKVIFVYGVGKNNEVRLPLQLDNSYSLYDNNSNLLGTNTFVTTQEGKKLLVIDDLVKYMFDFTECYMEPKFCFDLENAVKAETISLTIRNNTVPLHTSLLQDSSKLSTFTTDISIPKDKGTTERGKLVINLKDFTFNITDTKTCNSSGSLAEIKVYNGNSNR